MFDIEGKLFRVLRCNVTFCKLLISPPAVIFTAWNLQLYPYSPPRNTQTEAFAGLVINDDQTFDRYVPVIYGIHVPKHKAWFRDNLTLALQSRWELLFGNLVKAVLCLWCLGPTLVRIAPGYGSWSHQVIVLDAYAAQKAVFDFI